MQVQISKIAFLAALVFIAGCTTEQAKRAMDKPVATDQYSGFGAGKADGSKRKADKPKPVKEDMAPDEAVSTLVDQLQHTEAGYSITAEDQLMYWGEKPGVGPIVARRVRPLLKSSRIEQRAPALRLTIAFGGRESMGDLIECLGDSEYAIRDGAYRAVQNYSPRDFGYDPTIGGVARSQSVDQYRRWWQYETKKGAVLPPSVYETNPAVEARVRPATRPQSAVTGIVVP